MKTIRVIIAKFELESHDRGARLIAKMLTDAGMEVIYLIFKSIDEVVNAAIQEDVDVIGLSTLQGDTHKVFATDLMQGLKERNLDKRILVIIGGRVPNDDKPGLYKLGVKGIFGPGSLEQDIIGYIKENLPRKEVSVG
jgi:methylmalonyl-CoA mutase C-terminal domain/subunit